MRPSSSTSSSALLPSTSTCVGIRGMSAREQSGLWTPRDTSGAEAEAAAVRGELATAQATVEELQDQLTSAQFQQLEDATLFEELSTNLTLVVRDGTGGGGPGHVVCAEEVKEQL